MTMWAQLFAGNEKTRFHKKPSIAEDNQPGGCEHEVDAEEASDWEASLVEMDSLSGIEPWKN